MPITTSGQKNKHLTIRWCLAYIMLLCMYVNVCTHVEEVSALLGSPPTCHTARGVNFLQDLDNTHRWPSYGQNTPKTLVGFNVSFRIVRWSRIVVVPVNRSESVLECGRRAQVLGGTAASLFAAQTNRFRISLRDQHTVKILPKHWWGLMWVSEPYADHE